MRPLQITLLIVGLLVLSTQTLRHVYVKWVEPTGSVLDAYREPVEEDIALSKDLAELEAMYAEAHAARKAWEVNPANAEVPYRDRHLRPAFQDEEKIRQAIHRWEGQSRSLFVTRFYWFCGLAAIVLGLLAFARVNRWLGMVGLIAGFSEMAVWTSPLWRVGGPQGEFERLLDTKLTLSIISVVLLIALWLWSERRGARVPAPARS